MTSTNTDTAPIICRSLRQLDALVAERLFGWRWWRLRSCSFRSATAGQYRILMDLPHEKAHHVHEAFPFVEPADCSEKLADDWDLDLPHYTTWAMLGEVVAKVEAAGYWWDIGGPWDAVALGQHSARLGTKGDYRFDVINPQFRGDANVAPVAVALAALAAFGCRVQLELGGE